MGSMDGRGRAVSSYRDHPATVRFVPDRSARRWRTVQGATDTRQIGPANTDQATVSRTGDSRRLVPQQVPGRLTDLCTSAVATHPGCVRQRTAGSGPPAAHTGGTGRRLGHPHLQWPRAGRHIPYRARARVRAAVRWPGVDATADQCSRARLASRGRVRLPDGDERRATGIHADGLQRVRSGP
jgi:hypothetical protein